MTCCAATYAVSHPSLKGVFWAPPADAGARRRAPSCVRCARAGRSTIARSSFPALNHGTFLAEIWTVSPQPSTSALPAAFAPVNPLRRYPTPLRLAAGHAASAGGQAWPPAGGAGGVPPGWWRQKAVVE